MPCGPVFGPGSDHGLLNAIADNGGKGHIVADEEHSAVIGNEERRECQEIKSSFSEQGTWNDAFSCRAQFAEDFSVLEELVIDLIEQRRSIYSDLIIACGAALIGAIFFIGASVEWGVANGADSLSHGG